MLSLVRHILHPDSLTETPPFHIAQPFPFPEIRRGGVGGWLIHKGGREDGAGMNRKTQEI